MCVPSFLFDETTEGKEDLYSYGFISESSSSRDCPQVQTSH